MQAGARVAARHRDRAQNPQHPQWRGALCQPGRQDAAQERRGAAVENRHFGAVNLDQQVVHAAAVQRGHQVFDRADLCAGGVAQQGAQAGLDPVGRGCGNVAVTGQVGAAKYDAVIIRCRAQPHAHRGAAVQPDAPKRDGVNNRGLHAGPVSAAGEPGVLPNGYAPGRGRTTHRL